MRFLRFPGRGTRPQPVPSTVTSVPTAALGGSSSPLPPRELPGAVVAAALMTAQRRTVGKRIHDRVAPALTAAALRLGLAVEGVPGAGDPEAALRLLEDARAALHEILVSLDGSIEPAVLAEAQALLAGPELSEATPSSPVTIEQAFSHLLALQTASNIAASAAA